MDEDVGNEGGALSGRLGAGPPVAADTQTDTQDEARQDSEGKTRPALPLPVPVRIIGPPFLALMFEALLPHAQQSMLSILPNPAVAVENGQKAPWRQWVQVELWPSPPDLVDSPAPIAPHVLLAWSLGHSQENTRHDLPQGNVVEGVLLPSTNSHESPGRILVFDLRPNDNDPATLHRAAEQLSHSFHHSFHHAALCLHDNRDTLLLDLIAALTGGSFRSPLLDALLPLAVHPAQQSDTCKYQEESPSGTIQGGLSDRERQIAELCVTGLTNQEIAARLFVSVSTVKTHLARAFAKLGVKRRCELAEALLHDPNAGSVD